MDAFRVGGKTCILAPTLLADDNDMVRLQSNEGLKKQAALHSTFALLHNMPTLHHHHQHQCESTPDSRLRKVRGGCENRDKAKSLSATLQDRDRVDACRSAAQPNEADRSDHTQTHA